VKIGLFGGTFDPPHRGHLAPVQAARRRLGLERVLYLPTARPPHKPDRPLAPGHARYAMVELALLSEEGLYASPHELTPERRAFTVDTLEHFRRELPGSELFYLLGSDAFARLHTWRRWREIPALARLVVLARPGCEPAGAADTPDEVRSLVASGRAVVVDEAAVDLSSSALRECFHRGERPPAGSVPRLVLDYVEKYRLYR
jgi:nicotinate-nucleotide adenylyltransferase